MKVIDKVVDMLKSASFGIILKNYDRLLYRAFIRHVPVATNGTGKEG